MIDQFFSLAGKITVVVGLIAAVFSFAAWFQSSKLRKSNRDARKRQESPIRIVLVRDDDAAGSKGEELELPYRPRRDQLSRAELQGVLALYFGDGHYDRTPVLRIIEGGGFHSLMAVEPRKEKHEDDIIRIAFQSPNFDRFKQAVEGTQGGRELTQSVRPRSVTP